MKIALTHIRHSKTGGTERYLDYLSAFLADKGEDVTILCRRHEEKPHPNITFITFDPISIGVGHRYLRFARAVEKHLQTHHYDVVFGLGRTISQDIFRLGGGCHRTYYETVHRVVNHPLKQLLKMTFVKHQIYLKLEKNALNPDTPQMVICNSKAVKKDIQLRYGIKNEKIRVIYNGVDINRFHPDFKKKEGMNLRSQLNIPEEAFVILFLGNGYKRKGLDILLNIFPKLRKFNLDTYLLVVGHDSNLNNYQSIAKKKEVNAHIRFLGKRKDTQICYAASDLYVLPSRYDPFANSTIEAMSSGLPVISSKENGGSELIIQGENGTVVDLDENSIFNGICHWMDRKRNLRGQVSSRKIAEQHHIKSKLEEAYSMIKDVYQKKIN